MKRVYKYPTGADVPSNAKYLTTVVQTKIGKDNWADWDDCFFVWHYYEVQIEEDHTLNNPLKPMRGITGNH